MRHCKVIVVRGAPGVGKSSLVKQMRRQLHDAFIIDIDDIWRMWAPPMWGCREREKRILLLVRQLVTVMRETVQYIVILGCLNHRDIRLVTGTANLSLISIYLGARELRRRLRQRGGYWAKEEATRIAIRVNAEIRRSRLKGKRIDLTELSFIEAATAIIDACQEEHYVPAGGSGDLAQSSTFDC